MKRILGNIHKQAQIFIQSLSHSVHRNMSRGAENIKRVMSWARNENWRGSKERRKSSRSDKK